MFKDLSRLWYYHKMDIGYESMMAGKPIGKIRTLTSFVDSYFIRQPIARIVCKIKGHQWEVESEITPDRGSEHFHCTRCHAGHRIIYY